MMRVPLYMALMLTMGRVLWAVVDVACRRVERRAEHRR